MFPLSTVLFPHASLPLHVFEERYQALMADCLAGDGEFGVVLISRGSEVGGGDQRVDVGTVARLTEVAGLDDGRMLVMSQGTGRILIDRWLDDAPYPRAVVEELGEELRAAPGAAAPALMAAEAALRRLRSLLSELGEVPALAHDLDIGGGPEETGWHLCELAPLTLVDRQHLLACSDLTVRMELLAELCTALSGDVVHLLAQGGGDGGGGGRGEDQGDG
jgi:Lon protease-like protein